MASVKLSKLRMVVGAFPPVMNGSKRQRQITKAGSSPTRKTGTLLGMEGRSMSVAVHKILLPGEEHFGGKLPPRHLGLLLAELPLAVREAVSMALRNRSRLPGSQPKWLACAADVRFIGHGENGVTTLYFEAPVLGEAAREIYQQQQLSGFSTRPSPDNTGFDLLGDVLADVQRRDADSGNYDNALLSRIARFHKVLDKKSPYCEIDFTSRRYSAEQPAKVTRDTITSAKSLLRRTPAPQRLRSRWTARRTGSQHAAVLGATRHRREGRRRVCRQPDGRDARTVAEASARARDGYLSSVRPVAANRRRDCEARRRRSAYLFSDAHAVARQVECFQASQAAGAAFGNGGDHGPVAG